MKKYPLSTLFLFSFFLLTIEGTLSQQLFKGEKFLFPENRELIRSLKIRSKSMNVYVYINGELVPPKEKNLFESCFYDNNGNIIEDYYPGFDGKIKCTKYNYSGNRLIRMMVGTIGNEPDTFEDLYYDSLGNLVKKKRYSIRDTNGILSEYTYDACNVLMSKRTYGQYLITYMYEYDSIGNLINTIEENPFENRHSYSRALVYSKNGLVLEIENYSDGILESTFSFKYDNNSNKIEEKVHWEDLYEDLISTYSYDDKGRIIGAVSYRGLSMVFNSEFKYDSRGLLIEKRNFSSNGEQASVYKYVYE